MSNVANGVDQQSSKAEIAISKGWVQGVALVMIFGFLVMGILAYRTYTDSMPLPAQVVSEGGETVFTEEEVTSGQEIFPGPFEKARKKPGCVDSLLRQERFDQSASSQSQNHS